MYNVISNVNKEQCILLYTLIYTVILYVLI